MADVNKIKQQLKEWESAFHMVHQRKPAKDDIREAPNNIRDLYRAYQAARQMNESSTSVKPLQSPPSARQTSDEAATVCRTNNTLSQDTENNKTEVWGRELNKKTKQDTVTSPNGEGGSGKSEGSALLNKLGDKLFSSCSSTPAARFSAKKKPYLKPATQTQDFCPTQQSAVPGSTPTSSKVFTEEFTLKGAMFEKAIRLSSGKRLKSLDNVEVPQKFVHSFKPKRQYSFGGHSQLGEKDCEDSEISSFNHNVSPGSKFADFGSDEVDAFSVGTDMYSESEQGFLHTPAKRNTSVTVERSSTKKAVLSQFSSELSSDIPQSTSVQDDHASKPVGTLTLINSQEQQPTGRKGRSTLSADDREENFTNSRKRETRTRTVMSQNSHKSISEIVNAEDGDKPGDTFAFSDTEFGENSLASDETAQPAVTGKKGTRKGGEKTKVAGKRKAETASSGPRKRKKLDKEVEGGMVEGGDNSAEERPQPAKPPVKKSRAAGTGNISGARKTENFVRLNMKAKKFVRKGSGMTGGQWKRKQWKQKMAARSKSYGDKCFKCGGSGHWANKCPENGGQRQPSMGGDIAPVDEQGYPSLRSAALMARGVKSDDAEPEADEELAVEAMVVRERREAVIVPAPVTPLGHMGTDVAEEIQKGLQTFGFTSFKPGQQETVTRILNGQSTLVILSTGGGKSLCYQLPAYLYAQHTKGITLVISPLVSLMEDQVTGLPPGVKGACLNSNMTPAQRDCVLADVNAGKVHFLLVSPEAVVGGGGRGPGSFPSSDKLPPIFFACIDEVHCLSEWSHNFRPSYLRLCKVLRERYGVTCFLGLTATATRSSAADVVRHLGIADIEAATVRGSPVPPNLILSVSRDASRDESLVNLLQGKRFSSCCSIIIYCTRRDQVERVATLIRTCLQISDSRGKKKPSIPKGKKSSTKSSAQDFDPEDWSVESYHAGLTPAQRRRVQKAFMSGHLRVVVATVAFGMGLDKPDVRGIIHYNMPKSFENYVQEIGRAGRDGKTSHCHLFLDSQEAALGELQRHTFGNSVDRHTLKKLLQRVFTPCRCQQVLELRGEEQREEGEEERAVRVCPGHERALVIEQTVQDLDVREEGIETLMCYLELHVPELVSNLSPVYASCQMQCYGGPAQLQAVAKKCPPVAVAIARQKLRGESFSTKNSLEFPVVDLSDSMGWDSGPVKRELKALQWTVGPSGARKSGVIVNFSDLAFRVRACGDVSESEMDALLDYLHERVTRQERSELTQLARLAKTLRGVSHKNYWMCADEADVARSQTLKRHLDQHFDDTGENSETMEQDQQLLEPEVDKNTLQQLVSDVQQFVHLYSSEHQLTARAVARVLHGIDSPRFPAKTWGRVRRFWRAQLHVHFYTVLREATTQLLRIRR